MSDQLLIMFITILLHIESSNGLDVKPGDGGRAIGPLQIHTIYVDEVNRILGKKVYKYKDRKNKEKSVEMTLVHTRFHTPKNLKGSDLDKIIVMARIHNGGPMGHKEIGTINCINKVNKHYNILYGKKD